MAEVSHGGKLAERESFLVVSNDFSGFAWVAVDQNWVLGHFNFEFIRKFLVLCLIFLYCLKELPSLVRLHLSISEHLVLDLSEVPSLLFVGDTSDHTHLRYKEDILVCSFNMASN